MAISQGGKRNLLELHVTLSYAPSNTSSVLSEAQGNTPMASGRTLSGNAAAVSESAVKRAREAADAVVRRVAQDAARLATEAYANVGFPGLSVIVGPKQGTMYPLLVRGRDSEKYARILESGSSGMPMDTFIRGARKRREIKVERTDPKTGKVRPRGKKTEREPGFYMIIPKVLGTVSRTASGKLSFEGEGGLTLSRTNQDALRQFMAVPTEEARHSNHEDPDEVSEYRTGNREIGFTPIRLGGKTVMELDVTPETDVGNLFWDSVKYEGGARKAGQMDKEGHYSRPTQDNPDGAQRANKRGYEAMKALDVNNLRVNSPDALLMTGSAQTQGKAAKQRGQVVSFITISTRSADSGKYIGKTEGHHILRQAAEYMRDQLRDAVAQARMQASGKDGYYQRAFIEVLESAAR